MNVYDVITQKIIEKLNKGCVPWHKGWFTRPAVSHETGRPYSFLNQILLEGNGGEWLTFKQVEKEGGKIKKGEKGSVVMFFTWKEEEMKDANGNPLFDNDGDPKIKKIPIPKYYYVFEVGQCEGIERKYAPNLKKHDTVKEAEELIENYKANNPKLRITERVSNRAYYSLTEDEIILPEKGQFSSVNEFYSTAFHEMVHSTMTADRCNRDEARFGGFGDKVYSKEELVAEIGACFLCDSVGIEGTFDNSASYINSWLKKLKDDSKFIVTAAGKAEKAVEYIMKGVKNEEFDD